MTPGSLLRLLDGYHEREELQWRRDATMTAHLMNMSGRTSTRTFSPDDIVGKRKVRPVPIELTPEPEPAMGLDVVEALNALFGGVDKRA